MTRTEYIARIKFAKYLLSLGEGQTRVAKIVGIGRDTIHLVAHGKLYAHIRPSKVNPMPKLEAEEWIW